MVTNGCIPSFSEMKKILVALILYIPAGSFAQPFSSFYFLEQLPLLCNFTEDNIYFSSPWENKLIKTDYDGNIIWAKIVAALPIEFRDNFYYGCVYKTDSVILFKCDTAANVIWTKDISSTVCPRIGNDRNFVEGITVNHDRIYISTIQVDTIGYIDGDAGLLTLDTSGNFINSLCDFTSGNGGGLSHYDLNGYPSLSGAWINHTILGNSADEELVKINHDGTLDSGSYVIDFMSAQGNQIKNVVQLSDSTYIGFSQGNNPTFGSDNISIVRFNESTNLIWKNVITENNTAYFLEGSTSDSAGNIYILSSTYDLISSLEGPKVFVKADIDGNIVSSKGLDPTVPFDVKQMHYRNGNLYLFGDYHLGNQVYNGILIADTTFNPCNYINFPYAVQSAQGQIFTGIIFPIPTVPYIVGNYSYASNNVDTTTFVADLCLALFTNESHETPSVRIFPNPVTDKVTIEGIDHQGAQLRICNLTGEIILEKQIQDGDEIDLTDLPASIYSISIISKTSFLTREIIKL
jgi:hypothetical protein